MILSSSGVAKAEGAVDAGGASRRARRLGLLFGLAMPAVALGAVAAMLLAAVQPPMVWLTGLGRWQVQPFFHLAGILLMAWVVLAPGVGLLMDMLSPRLPGWRAPAVAAATVAGAAGVLITWIGFGGVDGPDVSGELWFWSSRALAASASAALCMHLCANAFERWMR